MLEYTKAAFSKIINDFKKIFNGIKITTQALSILYLLYAVISQTGVWIANVILLTLALGYFVFFLVMETKKGSRQVKKRVKHIYGWCKRLIKLLTIGITVYGLVLAKADFEPLSFLLVILMIFSWVLEFLFYIIIRFLEMEKELLLKGLSTDLERIPVLGGILSKKITKTESDAPGTRAKTRLKLDKLVGEERARKIRAKQEARAQKKERTANEKQEKARLKAEAKAAKKAEKNKN